MDSATIVEHIQAWWPLALALVAAIAKIINRMSLHWSFMEGPKKVFGLLVEILDFFHIPKFTPGEYEIARAEAAAQKATDIQRKEQIKQKIIAIRAKTGEFDKVK